MIIMNKTFSQEELALMSGYEAKSLRGLLAELQMVLPHMEDKLAADTTADCIDTLCGMTEADFPALQAEIAACELV